MSSCTIVLGMHRSGTSALAGILSKAGIDFGNRLLPAQEQNPKGFWEHQDIVALHEKALHALGSSWDAIEALDLKWDQEPFINTFQGDLQEILHRDFSRSVHWGVKDPRLCRLLPLWRDVLEKIGCQERYVLILRHPIEVAQSLRVRNSLPEIRASLSWLEHTLSAEYNSRSKPRIWLRYEDLLSDWRCALSPLLNDASVDLHLTPEICKEIDTFLDPHLRHQKDVASIAPLSEPLILAQDLYNRMPLLLENDRIEDEFSAVGTQLVHYREKMAPWLDCLRSDSVRYQRQIEATETLQIAVKELSIQLAGLEKEVTRIKSSLSWKLSMPLRLVQNLVHTPQHTLHQIFNNLSSCKMTSGTEERPKAKQP